MLKLFCYHLKGWCEEVASLPCPKECSNFQFHFILWFWIEHIIETCSVPFHRPPHLSSWPQNRFEMPCKIWSLSLLSIYSGLKSWGKTSQVSKRMLHRRNILNLPLNGQICNKNITVGKIAVKEHIWKDIWTLWRGVNFSRRLSFTYIVCLDLSLSISSTKSKMTAADQKLFQWTSNCCWLQVFLSDPSPIIVYSCHLLTDWLTHWLTDSCLVNLTDVTLACEDAYSKLEVVTVAGVGDEDCVGNSFLQIWKLRFGHKS